MKAITFAKEVKSEARKISWPSKKETYGATALVFVISSLFALFFMLVDTAVHKLIQYFLGF